MRGRVVRRLRDLGVLPSPDTTFTAAQVDQLRHLLAAAPAPGHSPATATVDALDYYCTELPSPQTALDIFAGEWAARMPPPWAHLQAGTAPLFEVEHVGWGVDLLGGVQGGRVLEVGPLEGGHTYILDRRGAAEVVAVEANTHAYLKCLVARELVGIPSARFLCGDAIRYLEDHLAHGGRRFDLCLASGVLYHFADPVAALDLMTRSSDRLVLWTMYYDEAAIRGKEDLSVKFPSATTSVHDGFTHTLYRQEYQGALQHKGFCGGAAASSAWMTRADILAALDHLGFEVVGTGFEELDHKGNGPCICIAARRRSTAPGGGSSPGVGGP